MGHVASNHDVETVFDGEQWHNRGWSRPTALDERTWLVETSYLGGAGVLLARSRRWLLLDADPSPERLDAWWDLLGTAGPVRERLIEALEEIYPLHDVSLVLVDLDDPGPAVLGAVGRVEDVDGGQRLTVGLDPTRLRPAAAGRHGPGRGGLRAGRRPRQRQT